MGERGFLFLGFKGRFLPHLWGWGELWQTAFLAHVFPCHLHRHAATYAIRMAPNYVGKQVRPFLQFHNCRHVGQIPFKCLMKGAVVNSKGVHRTLTAGYCPLRLGRMTLRAEHGRGPAYVMTLHTLLKSQLVIFAAVPEGFCVRRWMG